MEYLWYVGYGSNLCRERFVHYIKSGKFRLGGKECTGCGDKTFLDESKPFKIPHSLFFANNAKWWGNGGVAFISLKPEQNKYTYGRMWKVSRGQFSDIWNQEGQGLRWYDRELKLGKDDDGIPIVTITTSSDKKELVKPSGNYLKTMAIGLEETYHLDKKTISEYLIEKPALKGNLTKEKLLEIIGSN